MSKKKHFRFTVVYLLFVFLFFILVVKIAYLQIYRRDFFQNLSQRQHYGLFKIQGKRGKIIDRNGDILARSLNFYSVFADPFLINSKKKYAQILASKLDLCSERLEAQLSQKNRRFIWVKRKINWREKKEIEELNLAGIGFLREDQRFYPEQKLFSSLLGIVDIDNNGLEGLEFYYDQYLRGKEGWVRAVRDASSQRLVLTPSLLRLQKGADLVLGLDSRIQYWAKKYLKEQINQYQAKKGSLLVMDASNGEIIALANESISWEKAGQARFQRNYAIADMFEPGSVFKNITLAAALEEGVFFGIIDCHQGRMPIPGSVLNDWRPYGELSFQEVFFNSSNIGVAKIALSVGPPKIYEYIKKFGFGQKTGVDFPGEAVGMLKPFSRWSRTSGYIIPIGQEIGVNLLQLAVSFAAIANGGNLITPHLAKEICHQDICQELTFSQKRILPESVAQEAKEILIGVVEKGTGQRAAIKKEKIGGKTGTAQKFDLELGRYSSDKYRANFVGFISSTKRPVVIAVSIDEPKKSHFGGVVAAPLFRKIAEKVISYKVAD